MFNSTELDRFVSKIRYTDSCWLWTATKCNGGYGQFWFNGKMVMSHRFSYEHFVGKIPDGLELDHLCKVRECVNPDHLEAVSRKENIMRGDTFQSKNSKKTHCTHGHEFTEGNTRFTKLNQRVCRECERIRSKNRYNEKRMSGDWC